MDQQIPDLEGEIWADVADWHGYYQVSNLGRLKSLERRIPMGRGFYRIQRERLMKQSAGHAGRLLAILYRSEPVKFQKTILINRLVAQAFCPNPNNKPQVNHINCDFTDNRACNLEWVTCFENNQHASENRLNHGNNYSHIIRCIELGITTMGASEMARILSQRGVDLPVSSKIRDRAIDGEMKKYRGLTFVGFHRSELASMSADQFMAKLCIT